MIDLPVYIELLRIKTKQGDLKGVRSALKTLKLEELRLIETVDSLGYVRTSQLDYYVIKGN